MKEQRVPGRWTRSQFHAVNPLLVILVRPVSSQIRPALLPPVCPLLLVGVLLALLLGLQSLVLRRERV